MKMDTGFKDKNGNHIFLGDRIKRKYTKSDGYYTFIVKLHKGKYLCLLEQNEDEIIKAKQTTINV